MLVSRARRYMFVFVACVKRTLRQGENHQSVSQFPFYVAEPGKFMFNPSTLAVVGYCIHAVLFIIPTGLSGIYVAYIWLPFRGTSYASRPIPAIFGAGLLFVVSSLVFVPVDVLPCALSLSPLLQAAAALLLIFCCR